MPDPVHLTDYTSVQPHATLPYLDSQFCPYFQVQHTLRIFKHHLAANGVSLRHAPDDMMQFRNQQSSCGSHACLDGVYCGLLSFDRNPPEWSHMRFHALILILTLILIDEVHLR